MGTVQPTTRSGTAPAIFATPSTPSVYVSPTTQTNSTSSSVPPVVASVMPSVSNDNSSHIAGPSKSATGKRYIYMILYTTRVFYKKNFR